MLTWTAATAVLGARLALLGWTRVSVALLGVAVLLWVLLIGPVVRHWKTPTGGTSLLLTVATQSLAVLAATVALRTRTTWLEFAALVPFGLGLASYPLVMARFDLRELTAGHGDQWITGGALAISTHAACSFVVGDVARAGAIRAFGRVWVWVALAVWAVVFGAMIGAKNVRTRTE